jgi:hypothetical protein
MSKKRNIALLMALCALLGSAVFCGCSPSESSDSGSVKEKVGAHVADPVSMDAKGVLDDGGDINFSEPVVTAIGVKTSGEHKIVLGTNTDQYTLDGDAVLAEWSNSGHTYSRVRCSQTATLTFTMDFSGAADTSKVGCMITLINIRTYTCISVSSDGQNWTDIGYAGEVGIYGDYTTHITSLLGDEVSDSNLYQCYYALGEYITSSKILYVKCHYSDQYNTELASPVGTDVIGYASYFDSFEIEYDYL